jgi:hypothetical protein
VQTRSMTKVTAKASAENRWWRYPLQHQSLDHFVLKAAHGCGTLANEIQFLKQIRDADCIHLPELVWVPEGDQELGLVPVCKPIDYGEPAHVSRKIIAGLLDGLEHLHKLGIIHRDIRPSNLVLDEKSNVVIIDYETSIKLGATNINCRGIFVIMSYLYLGISSDSG